MIALAAIIKIACRRIAPICARNRPGTSPPGCHNQTDPLPLIGATAGVIRSVIRKGLEIAAGELERIAAGDHRVAILEFDEAAIHRAAR
jgi:hypothetical protein